LFFLSSHSLEAIPGRRASAIFVAAQHVNAEIAKSVKPLAKSIPDSASRARAKIANLLAAQQARPSWRTTTKSQIERASDFGQILPFGLRLLAAHRRRRRF
jgi:hypothetical protein